MFFIFKFSKTSQFYKKDLNATNLSNLYLPSVPSWKVDTTVRLSMNGKCLRRDIGNIQQWNALVYMFVFQLATNFLWSCKRNEMIFTIQVL